MITLIDLNAELAELTMFERTPTTPEAQRKRGMARLAPCRDGAIFTSKFNGTGGWERHRNGDEFVHIMDGATMLHLMTEDGRQSYALRAGMVVIIPQGTWHRFESPDGVTLMAVTPQPTDHPAVDVDNPLAK